MQPVECSAPLLGQFVATIRQQPEHAPVVICADSREIGSLCGDDRDRAGVDVVGLAAVAHLEGPHPRRQGRGHVDDMLAGGDESLGQQLTQAASAFDRPAALGPPGCPAQQLLRCRAGRPHSDRAGLGQARADRGRGVRGLVRINTDDDSHSSLLRLPGMGSTAGNLNSGNDHASIEPRRSGRRPARHAMKEPHRSGQEA